MIKSKRLAEVIEIEKKEHRWSDEIDLELETVRKSSHVPETSWEEVVSAVVTLLSFKRDVPISKPGQVENHADVDYFYPNSIPWHLKFKRVGGKTNTCFGVLKFDRIFRMSLRQYIII